MAGLWFVYSQQRSDLWHPAFCCQGQSASSPERLKALLRGMSRWAFRHASAAAQLPAGNGQGRFAWTGGHHGQWTSSIRDVAASPCPGEGRLGKVATWARWGHARHASSPLFLASSASCSVPAVPPHTTWLCSQTPLHKINELFPDALGVHL